MVDDQPLSAEFGGGGGGGGLTSPQHPPHINLSVKLLNFESSKLGSDGAFLVLLIFWKFEVRNVIYLAISTAIYKKKSTMKRTFIILVCALLSSFLAMRTQAQGYKDLYNRAYNLISADLDSALSCANTTKSLAKSEEQKYASYYLIALIAGEACFYDLSAKAYLNAKKHAKTGKQRNLCNAGIATTKFNSGDFQEAMKINKQNLRFWREQRDYKNLSYGYDLLGRLFLRERNKEAIATLKDALELRISYYPQEEAYSRENLALAYFTFGMYGKAVEQQKIANKTYPIKTLSKSTYNKATLAKYLTFSGKISKAKEILSRVDDQNLGFHSQLFLVHSKSTLQQFEEPNRDAFVWIDSLIQARIRKKGKAINKQAFAKKAVGIYEDVLRCRLPEFAKIKYEGRLNTTNAYLDGFRNEIRQADKQNYASIFGEQAKEKSWFSWDNLPFVIGFFVLVFFLPAYFLISWRKGEQDDDQLVHERKLLSMLEQKMDRSLTTEEKEIVFLMLQGKSFGDLQTHFAQSKDKLKYKAKKIAQSAKLDTTLYEFIRSFRKKLEGKSRKKQKSQ